MRRNLAGAVLTALFLTGCGYVGNPLPPLANVPAPVTDLAAVQRDGKLIVRFKLPTVTTEAVLIKSPLKLDLRIGPAAEGPFQPRSWAGQAKAIPPGDVQNGVANYVVPSAEWTSKNVVIGARVIGSNGKQSDWAALEALPIVPPPAPPEKPKIDSTADGLRLSWGGPPGDFRVYRRVGDEKNFAPVADVSENSWSDHSTEFGKEYAYLVQRIVKLGVHREAESNPSEEANCTPVDTFPPAAPKGLRAAPAAGSVELSWDRNLEPDLGGYRVYRAIAGGNFEKIADVSQIPTYSDHAVEGGKAYRYQIAALDKSGNESGRSDVVEALLP